MDMIQAFRDIVITGIIALAVVQTFYQIRLYKLGVKSE